MKCPLAFYFLLCRMYVYIHTLHIYIIYIYVQYSSNGRSSGRKPTKCKKEQRQRAVFTAFLKKWTEKKSYYIVHCFCKDGLMQKNVPSISPIDIKNLGVPSQIRLKYFNVILVLIEKNRTLLGGVIQTYPGNFFKKKSYFQITIPKETKPYYIFFFRVAKVNIIIQSRLLLKDLSNFGQIK